MKRICLTIAAALLVGVSAFCICYFVGTQQLRELSSQPNSSIAWLASEFHLNEEDTAKIQDLHKAYDPICMEMCRKIASVNARLDQQISTQANLTPELEAALKEKADLQAECHRVMLDHVYKVSAIIPQEYRAQYLAMMKPSFFAGGFPHQTVPGP